ARVVPDGPAAGLGAEAEVDVTMGGEEAPVEPAQLVHDPASDQAPARRDEVAGRGARRAPLGEAAEPRVEVAGRTRRLRRPVPVHDAGADDADAGIGGRPDESDERVRLGLGVVVKTQHEVRARPEQPTGGGPAAEGPQVLGAPVERDPRPALRLQLAGALADGLLGAVGRAVVEDDHLEPVLGVLELPQAPQAALELGAVVPGRDQHGDERWRGYQPTPRSASRRMYASVRSPRGRPRAADPIPRAAAPMPVHTRTRPETRPGWCVEK